MGTTIHEISGILAFIALLFTLLFNIWNMRARLKEPEEARWRTLDEWKKINEEGRRVCYKRFKDMERRLDKLEDFDRQLLHLYSQRADFDQIILSSIRVILDIIPTYDEGEEAKNKIRKDIDQFYMNLNKHIYKGLRNN